MKERERERERTKIIFILLNFFKYFNIKYIIKINNIIYFNIIDIID